MVWIYPEQDNIPDILQLMSSIIFSTAMGTLGSLLRDKGIFNYANNRFYSHIKTISALYMCIIILETCFMTVFSFLLSFSTSSKFRNFNLSFEIILLSSTTVLLWVYSIIILVRNINIINQLDIVEIDQS